MKEQYCIKKRSFVATTYCSTKSIKQTQSLFSKEFGIDRRNKKEIPNERTIRRWVANFKNSGTVKNKSTEERKPREPTVRTADNVASTLVSVNNSPKKSIRRRSVELKIPRESLRTILKTDLHLKPYTIQMHQRLHKASVKERLTMCRWFLSKIEEDAEFLNNVWFSDEAHFSLNGYVNSKNYVFWGSSKPNEVYEQGLHDLKVTAWIAMSRQGLIGPFFFMDENKETVTVTSERYITILNLFWKALGRFLGTHNRTKQWFQQDGAPPHAAERTLHWLRDHFNDRIISRRTPYTWAPHSPDLNPLDFHIWGFLKDLMLGRKFNSLEELRTTISNLTNAIPRSQCEKVIDNFCFRLKECIRQNGGHVEHML